MLLPTDKSTSPALLITGSSASGKSSLKTLFQRTSARECDIVECRNDQAQLWINRHRTRRHILCLYLLQPNDFPLLHPPRPAFEPLSNLLDLAVISKRSNNPGARLIVLPLLSKGDTYTVSRLRKTKQDTSSLLPVADQQDIWSVISPDWSDDIANDDSALDKLAAVCASLSPSPPPETSSFVRQYPWGACHPLDPAHSDTHKLVEWVTKRVAELEQIQVPPFVEETVRTTEECTTFSMQEIALAPAPAPAVEPVPDQDMAAAAAEIVEGGDMDDAASETQCAHSPCRLQDCDGVHDDEDEDTNNPPLTLKKPTLALDIEQDLPDGPPPAPVLSPSGRLWPGAPASTTGLPDNSYPNSHPRETFLQELEMERGEWRKPNRAPPPPAPAPAPPHTQERETNGKAHHHHHSRQLSNSSSSLPPITAVVAENSSSSSRSSSSSTSPAPPAAPKKQRKAKSQFACAFCRSRKLKCALSKTSRTSCAECQKRGYDCDMPPLPPPSEVDSMIAETLEEDEAPVPPIPPPSQQQQQHQYEHYPIPILRNNNPISPAGAAPLQILHHPQQQQLQQQHHHQQHHHHQEYNRRAPPPDRWMDRDRAASQSSSSSPQQLPQQPPPSQNHHHHHQQQQHHHPHHHRQLPPPHHLHHPPPPPPPPPIHVPSHHRTLSYPPPPPPAPHSPPPPPPHARSGQVFQSHLPTQLPPPPSVPESFGFSPTSSTTTTANNDDHPHGRMYSKSSRSGPKVVACNYCRARKTRCDGGSPCSNCNKRHLPCEYVKFGRESARRRSLRAAAEAAAAAEQGREVPQQATIGRPRTVPRGEQPSSSSLSPPLLHQPYPRLPPIASIVDNTNTNAHPNSNSNSPPKMIQTVNLKRPRSVTPTLTQTPTPTTQSKRMRVEELVSRDSPPLPPPPPPHSAHSTHSHSHSERNW